MGRHPIWGYFAAVEIERTDFEKFEGKFLTTGTDKHAASRLGQRPSDQGLRFLEPADFSSRETHVSQFMWQLRRRVDTIPRV